MRVRVLGVGLGVSGLVFLVSGFGCRVHRLVFTCARVWVRIGLRVEGAGFRV